MSYKYENLRSFVFTERGQVMLLELRDRAFMLTALAGAATVAKIIAKTAGDPWNMLACIDRLVEIGDLKYVNYGPNVWGQNLILVKGRE